MTKVRPAYLRLLIFSLIALGLVLLGRNQSTQAGNLREVSVVMSNSRFSFLGKTTAVDGTVVDIAIADGLDNYIVPGTTDETDVLVVGDTLNFGIPATPVEYDILEVVDGNTIIVDDAAVSHPDTFFLAETSQLTANFKTRVAVDDGAFEVLVPAAAANSSDGYPNQGFFDYGTAAPTVTCEADTHTITTPGSSSAGQTGAGYPSGTWHVYRCVYTGAGDNDDEITITISNIINPSPKGDHTTGVADTYDIYVRHLDSGDEEVDVTRIKIGVIEAVRVSATVVPSLTFIIEGNTDLSTLRCGVAPSVATDANSVAFGDLIVGTFINAVQRLEVRTNASEGAVVTALSYDQLGRNGGACAGKLTPVYSIGTGEFECIWDANVATMSHENAVDWDDNSDTGFGYSIDDYNSNTTPAFEYDTGGDDFRAKHFADYDRGGAGTQEPQPLFNSGEPTNDDDIYLCYRINADALTAAGEYHTYITYTATATF
jgi:hypothetical protein